VTLAAASSLQQERAFHDLQLQRSLPTHPHARARHAQMSAPSGEAGRGSEQQQPRLRLARRRACTVCDMLGAAWRRLQGAS